MRLTLIRHGPTEWNASRRFQGQTDLPLSEHGRRVAAAIADALRGEPFDAIYASDLRRAMETAAPLAETRQLDVTGDARLREFHFGQWEGLRWDEIVAVNPHLAGEGSTAAKRYAPPGGESFDTVCARVASFLDELTARPQRNVAIVTHAGPLHALFDVLHSERPDNPGDNLSLHFTPGGITRVTLEEGRAAIDSLDDRQHLDSLDAVR
ncbi:MAG TPA: histidine phosphatase family protein [Candidatus Cybelea sp.]|jgi:probable phosphoglycerate mutase|nr:histidine phosphatase family protein [Candidatus Cybelea sp.]